MKHTLVALVLVAAACTGSEDARPQPAGLAILGSDRNIALLDLADEARTELTDDAGPDRIYSQPTWSPDGSRLAFSVSSAASTGPGIQAAGGAVEVALESQAPVENAIHLIDVATGTTDVVETSFGAFYLYWSPDGTSLAFLGSDPSRGELGLGLVDVPMARAEVVDHGEPYFFAWSPASDRLLVHASGSAMYFLSLDGTRTELADSPGGFTAPGWVDDTLLVGWDDADGPSSSLLDPEGSITAQGPAYDHAVALGLNPDAERFAYINISQEANPLALGELIVWSAEGATTVAEDASAFFWDSNGEQLLFLTADLEAERPALRWSVWDGDATTTFEAFRPTPTFLQEYLPFFSQYGNSLTLFSPDGGSFTFAGSIEGRGEGIWVQDIHSGEPARLVGDGEFSTWSP